MSRGIRRALVLAGVVLVVLVPLVATPYTNLQLSLIAAYAIALLGLDVITGRTGEVSLGQSAFFGLGAYTGAILINRGWPILAALVAAALLSALIGLAAAVPAVRVRGFAFGIITLTLPVAAVPLANRLDGLTGGSQGLSTEVVAAPGWTGLAEDQWQFLVIAAVGAVTFLLVRNLLDGRVGRGLDAIRANEAVAAAMGVPVQRYKVLAFVVAATCGGVAGWCYVLAVQFVSPESLQLTLAISLLVGLVVGGLRSRVGVLLGAAFYVELPRLTDGISPERSYLVYGICLLVVLLFFPGGIAGGLQRLVRRTAALTHDRRGGASGPGPVGSTVKEETLT